MVPRLVKKFNVDGHFFVIEKCQKEFVETNFDYHNLFGLHLSNICDPRNSANAKSDEYKYIRNAKYLLGLHNSDISLKRLNELLLKLYKGDYGFLLVFLSYASSVFFKSYRNQNI